MGSPTTNNWDNIDYTQFFDGGIDPGNYKRDSKDVDEAEYQDHPGSVLFNQTLIPSGLSCATLNCKQYTPNTHSSLYYQIEQALKANITFTACLIDVHDSLIPRAVQMIDFCKIHDIRIFLFEYSNNICQFDDAPAVLKGKLEKNQSRIIKETCSIFSVPYFHKQLNTIKPDALIVLGSLTENCIEASVLGSNANSTYTHWHGTEYGAVQYGLPVYTHEELLFSHQKNAEQHLKHDRVFKFKDIEEI